MGFFNDITKKTIDITAKITREAKLKIRINEDKSKIKELYEAIGKKIYENNVKKNKINIEQIIEEDCINLDKLSESIQEAREEILILNNKKMCKKCFAQIEANSKFCPECGDKQTHENTIFEKAEERLEKLEILQKNKKEAEIVKEELEQKNSNQ